MQLDGGTNIDSLPGTESIGILYPGERFDALMSIDSKIGEFSKPFLRISLDKE